MLEVTPRKPIIGLMGGPASGKSFVASLLAELGCGVVDADRLARAALETPAVLTALQARWGEGVLDTQGQADRKAIAARVFEQPQELKWLESILHPQVASRRAAMHRQFRHDVQVAAIVEDCPLLLETGLDASCDVLVFVDASEELRAQRAAARGWSPQELARRSAAQAPLDTKRMRADHVVNSSADRETLRRRLDALLHDLSPGHRQATLDPPVCRPPEA